MPYVQMPGWVGAQQSLQENSLFMQAQQSDLQSAALNQEATKIAINAKKAELANEEAFKANLLQQLSASEDNRNQLADLAGQPTPYQQKQSSLKGVEDKINSHISLMDATQKAIDAYAKVDPIYAQKQQALLNEQIKQGFDLAKEHNKMKQEQATQLSNELFPVLNVDGETGKLDEGAYKALYQKHLEEGTPLASFGLTGNLQQDKDRLRVMYSHGVAAKDQAMQQAKAISMREQQWRDETTRKSYEERVQHDRAAEALGRDRISAIRGKEKVAKDPVLLANKAQQSLYQSYLRRVNPMISARDAASDPKSPKYDPVKASDLNRRIKAETEAYESMKETTSAMYHTTPVKSSTGEAATTNIEEDLISKYSK